jgi:hypothetical protein
VVEKDGRTEFQPDHADPVYGSLLLLRTLGTTNHDFVNGVFRQLATLATLGQKADQDTLNFMLSIINGISPRDETEAMLATQMAAVHLATMTLARQLDLAKTLDQQDSAERAFNKLTRTFATQMEMLKRYRTGGKQQVRVEHVHVHAGAQAVVGVVEAPPGRGQRKSKDQPHAKLSPKASQPALRSENAKGQRLPITRHGKRPLPNAWREISWCSQRESQRLEARMLLNRDGHAAQTGASTRATCTRRAYAGLR